jgi:hypothetical protein
MNSSMLLVTSKNLGDQVRNSRRDWNRKAGPIKRGQFAHRASRVIAASIASRAES